LASRLPYLDPDGQLTTLSREVLPTGCVTDIEESTRDLVKPRRDLDFTRVNSRRKEVRNMKYEKPEVVVVDSACGAIQGVSKMGLNVELSQKPTVAAYEADE
jgi:hypothetical protein